MNKSKYPIYVISKNRVDVCYTAKFLIKDNMDFQLVVEPQHMFLEMVLVLINLPCRQL